MRLSSRTIYCIQCNSICIRKRVHKGTCILLHDCPMFRRSYIQKVLCSESPMFRKYLFRRSYVQMVSYSEDPMFRKSYVQKYLFKRSYTQKVTYVQKTLYSAVFVWKVLYPEGPMFRRSYIQNILCSEGLMLEHISIFQLQV